MNEPPIPTEERLLIKPSSENWQKQLSANILELKVWWAGLELETKAFIALLLCLCTNIFLISIAWNVYGDKLTKMFMKGSVAQSAFKQDEDYGQEAKKQHRD